MLLHRLGQVGTGIVWAARQGTGLNGFNNPAFVMSAGEVRNIALRMLQNPLLRSVIQVNPGRPATYTTNTAQDAIVTSTHKGERKAEEEGKLVNTKNGERKRAIVENEVKKHDIRKRNAHVNIK